MPWQYDPHSDPNLGLLSVAASARSPEPGKENLEIEWCDLSNQRDVPEADFYAMSATTLEYPLVKEMAEKIRSENKGCKIIVGGVHFDVFSEDYWDKKINDLPFDVICRGEGESTIKRAIDFASRNNEKKVISQRGKLLNLEELAMPARDLLSERDYFKEGRTFSNTKMAGDAKSGTIMASRGCPYSCSFCASPSLHKKKLRFGSSKNVMNELIELRTRYRVSDLRWQDDNFPLTLRKLKGLDNFLKDYGFRYRASLRTDPKSCNPNMLKRLWESGCREVGFGVESADQEVLNLNQKGTTVENNLSAIRAAKDQGFLVRAFVMSGLPGETRDSGKRLAEFIERNYLYLDTITLTTFTPLPGCDIFNNPIKYNIKSLHQDWERYNIAITRDFQEFPFVHEINGLTRKEMVQNLERIKQTVFRRNLSNVNVYNDAAVGESYKSPIL